MTAIKIDRLSKSFGRKKVLDNLSLDVAPGEMVALIGASGAGKSTLLRHISGLLIADSDGRSNIEVHGRTVQASGRLGREAQDVRRNTSIIFQQFNLVGRLSVLTNVLTGLLGHMPGGRGTLGLFTRAEKQIAMRALHRVGIADTALQRASTLSGGQQQRAAIARAMVQGANILLADEPIASLDPASAKRVMGTLADINAMDGVTIVVSLHQVEYARHYCPRTIAMRDGAVAYDGPSDALDQNALRDLYGDASEELILPEAAFVQRPAAPPIPMLGAATA